MYQRKTKKRRKNSGLLIILILIFIYIIFKIGTILFNNVKTFIPKEEIISDSILADGVIIKKEEVYTATNNGNLELFIKEGERIKSGTKIATLTSSDDSIAIEKELFQIEQSLIDLEESSKLISDLGSGVSEEDLNTKLIMEVQKNIKEENLENIFLLKEQLMNQNSTNDDKNSSTDLKETLERERENLLEAVNKSIKHYYTDIGGLVSYKIDGLEDLYKANDFERYTYEKIKKDMSLENVKEVKNKQISINEPVYKLIDNFEWYIGITIDDLKKIEDIKENDIIEVELNKSKELIRGRIVKINKFKNNGVIITKFVNKLHDYYDLRFPKVKLVKSNKKGFIIPKEAVTKQEGKLGVFVKDLSSIVRFKQIEIINEQEDEVFIRAGNEDGIIENGKEKIRTITGFDEIILNPKVVKEGQIIN